LKTYFSTRRSFSPSALLYCMEHLEDSLDEWLGEELAGFTDDDYILFDCPGQVELYSHVSAFRTLADWLAAHNVRAAAVYCLDVQFVGEPAKFVAGCLAALGAMVQLELPHVNVLTKVDLLDRPAKQALRRHLVPDGAALADDLVRGGGGEAASAAGARLRRTYAALSAAVARLLDDWAMLSFVPLDRTGEGCGESSDDDDDGTPPDEGAGVAAVLAHVDHAIQYGEDAEVKVKDEREEEEGG
jgi:GPN-loop GTPase